MSKSFDKVWHDGLIKMSRCGRGLAKKIIYKIENKEF